MSPSSISPLSAGAGHDIGPLLISASFERPHISLICPAVVAIVPTIRSADTDVDGKCIIYWGRPRGGGVCLGFGRVGLLVFMANEVFVF